MEIEAKGARFGRESEARAAGNRSDIRMPIPARPGLRFPANPGADSRYLAPARPNFNPVLTPDFEPNYPLKSVISPIYHHYFPRNFRFPPQFTPLSSISRPRIALSPPKIAPIQITPYSAFKRIPRNILPPFASYINLSDFVTICNISEICLTRPPGSPRGPLPPAPPGA